MKNQLFCAVCGGSSDCSHFGVVSCRACSAFFRRKVIECRQIRSKCTGDCKVTTRRRNSCAKCRFEKCLKMGMKMTAVYRRLEQSRLPNPLESVFLSEPLGILEQLQDAYTKLEFSRKSAFANEVNYTPKLFNYKKMNEVLKTDFKMIIAITVARFEAMTDVPSTEHKLLLSNFLIQFYLLDCGFKSEGRYRMTLPTTDYMDVDHKSFFYSSEDVTGQRKEDVLKIMTPYWNSMGTTLVAHLMELNIDFQEFFFLTALLYWDHYIQDQSIECEQKCRNMRSRVIEELTKYEEDHHTDRDPLLRIGNLMMLLNSIRKIVILMEETRAISLVYNFYELHQSMFEALTI